MRSSPDPAGSQKREITSLPMNVQVIDAISENASPGVGG
jgi:hypothetical protein